MGNPTFPCESCGTFHSASEVSDAGGYCPQCDADYDERKMFSDLVSRYATLEAELARTAAQRDAILQQARALAGEAKTQRSTVLEVGEILGGIPDWGPIAAGVEAMAAENAKLRAELERRVPDGWKLVPDDLCVGMREAGKRVILEAVAANADITLDGLYTAMIAAAPSAPATVPDAITMAEVMKAWEYAEDHPHKYLRGTTNWCAAVAHSLNQQRVAAPSAPKADDPVKVQLLEALVIATGSIREICHERAVPLPASTLDRAEAAIAAARKGEGE